MVRLRMLERDGFMMTNPSRSSPLSERVIQTSDDSASGHHALTRSDQAADVGDAVIDHVEYQRHGEQGERHQSGGGPVDRDLE